MKHIEQKWQEWLAACYPQPTGKDLRELRFAFFAGAIALSYLIDTQDLSAEECEAITTECNEVSEEMKTYAKGVN